LLINPAWAQAPAAASQGGVSVAPPTTLSVLKNPSTFMDAPFSAQAGAVAAAVAGYQGLRFLGDQMGGTTGEILETPITGISSYGLKKVGDITGIKELGHVGKFLGDVEENVIQKPLDWVGSKVSSVFGTWICTAVQNAVGLDEGDKTALFNLRKYCLRNHPGWLHWYLDEGQKIVDGIEKTYSPGGLEEIYEFLKQTFVLPVTSLVKNGDMEGAYENYLQSTQSLCRQYAPDVEIKEHDLSG